MKVVIEHLITHYFLGLTNQWNPNIEDARLFESPEQALWFSFKKLRTPYNVVLRLEGSQYDFAISAGEDSAVSGFSEHKRANLSRSDNWMAALKENSRELVQSTRLLISESLRLAAQSNELSAVSRRGILSAKRVRMR